MSETYHRPLDVVHRSEIIELRSRFITTITRACSTEQARDFIASIRQEMPDASHHVYAFRVGCGNSITEGMSDDGEPSGTSGPPTLAVLRGTELGDIVLVTTRYFGGTKLGTGGLVRAYSEAARSTLNTLPTELKAPKAQIGMDVSYSLYERVKNLVHDYDGIINDEIFAGDITLIVTLLKEKTGTFKAELTELSAGQIEPILLETIED